MLLQGVDLRKCGGVKPIVVVHGWLASESSQCFARKTTVPPRVRFATKPHVIRRISISGADFFDCA